MNLAIAPIWNLDLLSVGIVTAANFILGFIVYFSNKKGATNEAFLLFTSVSALWGAVNYALYQSQDPLVILWLIRLVMFFATWQAFSFFYLANVFPKTNALLSIWFYRVLIPIVAASSIVALTPLVFSVISDVNSGGVPKAVPGLGIVVWGLVAVGFVMAGIFSLVKSMFQAAPTERSRFYLFLAGVVLMFGLIISFNFILPAFFNNPRFIPLGAIFIFPFIIFTTYAIFRHHLFNVKVITTEILTFILAVVTLLDVTLSRDILIIVFRLGVFILVLSFGILLIRSVRREVEQRERLEVLSGELAAANTKLQQLDKMRSEFFSFVSHQIKTPIAVVKGFATLLANGSYDAIPERAQETALRIREASDRLVHLVEDFLDLRKIESGKMEYNFEEADVVELVSGMVDELRQLAAQKKLALTFAPSAEKIMVRADIERLRQVFQNIIDNAIKYTETGSIAVSLGYGDLDGARGALFSVKDTGYGMSAEMLGKIFEQFKRDATVSKVIRGTGLGLYIAKEIVTGHGGKIWAESEGGDKGSTFFVLLPLAGPH